MNPKAWLATFAIVSLLLVGGSGFFAFSSYREYSDAMMNWDSKVGTIESLESRVPYPDEANSRALAERVEEYRKSVQELYETLETFQQPLDTALPSTEFQRKVANRVQQFRTTARSGGLALEDSTDFQMGFDRYSTAIPPQTMVPVLNYSLDAIDHLLGLLVEVGVDRLVSFGRDAIPGEDGSVVEQESRVVHRYPVRLRFESTHDAFQQLLNRLGNDRDFFYVVRVLKVNNSMREGPIKLTSGDGEGLPIFRNPNTSQVAEYEMLMEWGMGEISDEELEARAREAGFVSSRQDARVLMGQETLTVFMVVDITRFLSPEEVEAEGGEAPPAIDSSSRSRR